MCTVQFAMTFPVNVSLKSYTKQLYRTLLRIKMANSEVFVIHQEMERYCSLIIVIIAD